MGAEQKGSSKTTPKAENVQPGKELTDIQKDKAFFLALNFAGQLIEKKLDSSTLVFADRDVIVKYPSQPKEVQEYLKGAVLGRLADLHTKAIGAQLTDADSIVAFEDLRTVLCKELSLREDQIPDDVLNALIKERSDAYLDSLFNDARVALDFVRKASAIVISVNPTKPQNRPVSQQAID